MIVGLPTIRKYRLASKLPSVFEGQQVLNRDEDLHSNMCNTAGLENLLEPNLCKNQICSIAHSELLTQTICVDCVETSLGKINTVVTRICKDGEPCYTFGSNSGTLSNDGYGESGETRSFVRQLSTVIMSDECYNNGRVVGEQAYNSRDKPTTVHRREFLYKPIKDDEIGGKNILSISLI